MHGSNHTDLTSEHMTLSLVSLLVPDHRSKKPELHHSICVGAWFHLPLAGFKKKRVNIQKYHRFTHHNTTLAYAGVA